MGNLRVVRVSQETTTAATPTLRLEGALGTVVQLSAWIAGDYRVFLGHGGWWPVLGQSVAGALLPWFVWPRSHLDNNEPGKNNVTVRIGE